jgi:hypothetical protein
MYNDTQFEISTKLLSCLRYSYNGFCFCATGWIVRTLSPSVLAVMGSNVVVKLFMPVIGGTSASTADLVVHQVWIVHQG